MSKTKSIPTPPAVVPPEPEVELPLLDSVGWARLPKGWVVVFTQSRGDRILNREVLSEPEPKAFASERLMLGLVRKLLAAQRGER